MAGKTEDFGFTFARVVACFMVVLLHVAAQGFHGFDAGWWAANVYDSLTRACVPLFLMITGALLLPRQDDGAGFLRVRLRRLAPPLVFWSLFYLAWRIWRSGEPPALPERLLGLLQTPASYHLWYLYALVGITLFAPFLRLIWQHASVRELRLYLLIWLVVSGEPVWRSVFGWSDDPVVTYELAMFFGLPGYLLLGAWSVDFYRRHRGNALHRWGCGLLFVACSAVTMIATAWRSGQQGEPDPLFYDYLSPFVIGAAFAGFQLLYAAGTALSAWSAGARTRQLMRGCARMALGIYCAHVFLLEWAADYLDVSAIGYAAWWAIPLFAAVLFMLTLGLVMLMSRWRLLTPVVS